MEWVIIFYSYYFTLYFNFNELFNNKKDFNNYIYDEAIKPYIPKSNQIIISNNNHRYNPSSKAIKGIG